MSYKSDRAKQLPQKANGDVASPSSQILTYTSSNILNRVRNRTCNKYMVRNMEEQDRSKNGESIIEGIDEHSQHRTSR